MGIESERARAKEAGRELLRVRGENQEGGAEERERV